MNQMQAGLRELRQVLADEGIARTGVWLTHHFKIPDQTFDFDISLPVDTDVTPQGRVSPGELRATRLARTVYHGDYAGLPHGWGAFLNWIRAENLTMAGDFWEVYSLGPDDSTNPTDWRKELNCPLT
jgi:effector-binding domain-containing protein